MARTTDTRARVRALAAAWKREGRDLSPRAIREALGGGSQSTIVDELRRIREEALEAVVDDPLRDAAVADMLRASPTVPPRVREETPLMEEGPAPSSENNRLLQSLEQVLEQLQKQGLRFEALQRRALREVDEARQAAQYWQDLYERTVVEAKSQVTQAQDLARRESERANVLAGRLSQALGVPPDKL